MLGKANMDEFAMGSSNETSYYGPVRNPWNTDARAGRLFGRLGCGGGGASAPAGDGDRHRRLDPPAGGAMWSVRAQADLWPRLALRHGRFRLQSRPGRRHRRRPREDAALVMRAMAGFDPNDSTSVDRPVPDYAAVVGTPLKGLKIGVLEGILRQGLDPRRTSAAFARHWRSTRSSAHSCAR